MIIAPNLAAKISEWVKDYVLPSGGDTEEAIKVALKRGALPLYLEMGGVFALQLSGEIISIPWSEPENPRVECDQRIRNMVLFQGSMKYPELNSLIPVKQDDAKVCPYCNGTGDAPIPFGASNEARKHVVCYCGGLGWIP
ncbi:MAG: hypothetical protein ACREBD_04015 [Blastocatellia bacterium]